MKENLNFDNGLTIINNYVSLSSSSASSHNSTSTASTSSLAKLNSIDTDEYCMNGPVIITSSNQGLKEDLRYLKTESVQTKKPDLNNMHLVKKAVDEFIKQQNWLENNSNSSDARNWNLAVKFLMARKFDVDRAVKLYNEHQSLRKREGLDLIDLNDQDLIAELQSCKFTILPFIKNHPVFALFTVKNHSTSNNNLVELTTLKSLIYQLDAALENPDAQRNGINFIYDMNDCKRSNYDLTLSQKILTLIRGSYPARLNKLLVVSAPFWFKCVVKVLSILMREKLRERVLFVTSRELLNHVPGEILPEHLGGQATLNHSAWLSECNRLVTNKSSTCNFYYFHSANNDNSSNSNNTTSKANNHKTDDFKNIVEPFFSFKDKIEPIPFNDPFQSIQNECVYANARGFSNLKELVTYVKEMGSAGLSEQFKQIRLQPVVSSYDVFKDKANMYKNRYRDVICLDDTRVKLSSTDNDYIHANYVDGYRQKNAYISTQGPLDETVKEFWQMVWQETILVIAMTTKVIEQRKIKCAQYWPLESGDSLTLDDGSFQIFNYFVQDLDDYRVSKLKIKNLATNKTRNIVHCQFLSWPDHGVPKTSLQILEFIELVRMQQTEALKDDLNASLDGSKWSEHPNGPPICVHCSAGIGRTGTFLAIDICMQRLKASMPINIEEIVNRIRLQRAQSVQMRDQYVFCFMAVLAFAQREKILLDNSSLESQSFDLEKIFEGFF